MTEAAPERIERGLAAAHAAMLQGDLESMHAHLVATLDTLAQLTRAGFLARQQRAPVPWDGAEALRLVHELLARLHAADCHVFPYAGTLLGLERDGRLLANDKDADLAVWLEDFSLAGRLLQQWGLQRAGDVPPFANLATFVDAPSGHSVDLFGLRRDPLRHVVEGGVWLYDRPASHQRVLRLPWITLVPRTTPAGQAWWPHDPDALLAAFYGDWRTPQPEWDSLVSNRALQELNLNWRCWALKNLSQSWLSGDLARTRRLLVQIADRAAEDAQLRGWREALEAALA